MTIKQYLNNNAVHGFFIYGDGTCGGTTSWICPDGVYIVKLTMFGGGGAGGGSQKTGAPCGSGGGGGAYVIDHLVRVVPGTTYPLYVGGGGSPTVGASGGNGSTSSAFGIACNGGMGGMYGTGTVNPPVTLGGKGGGFVIDGAVGGSGAQVDPTPFKNGGDTPLARGGTTDDPRVAKIGGGGGAGYGSGGTGVAAQTGRNGGIGAGGSGAGTNSSQDLAGGFGGGGIIKIVW